MIKLWELIIHGCWHQWEIMQRYSLVKKTGDVPYGDRYSYKCEKCQRVKLVDVL